MCLELAFNTGKTLRRSDGLQETVPDRRTGNRKGSVSVTAEGGKGRILPRWHFAGGAICDSKTNKIREILAQRDVVLKILSMVFNKLLESLRIRI